jgi:hypothetical protein
MPLTDTAVRNAKRRERPQKLSDGGGLHLLVNPDGARYWRMAYRYQGRQKTLALGVYPIVSLAEARTARDAAKKLLACDVDPSQARKKQKCAASLRNTFEIVAREWCENQKDGWTARWWRRSGSPSIPPPGPRITATASSGVSNATSSRGSAGDQLPK